MSYSVEEFCKIHGISRAYFYQMLREGTGPRIYKVGPRLTRISEKANDDWIKSLEAATSMPGVAA